MERCKSDTENEQIDPKLELDLTLSLIEASPDKSPKQVSDLLLRAYWLDKSDLAFGYLEQAAKTDPGNL